jgi:hypothetical protein
MTYIFYKWTVTYLVVYIYSIYVKKNYQKQVPVANAYENQTIIEIDIYFYLDGYVQ